MRRMPHLLAAAVILGLALGAASPAQSPAVTSTTLTPAADVPAVKTVLPAKTEKIPGIERADKPTLFVSPNGRPEGPGAKETPYDLATVLSGKVTKPGDVVWMAEGTYPAEEKEVETPVKDKRGKPTGEKTKIRQRQAFVSELRGSPSAPVILRATPGARVCIDGWMDVRGAYAWYWGFEIADRLYAESDHREVSLKKAGVGTSLNVFAPGTRFINLDVHDGDMGFGFWSSAVDAEIYGCVIHNFGHISPNGGFGHGLVVQNDQGAKRIIDNVLFNGCGWNLHAYSETLPLRNLRVEGNISFSAGAAAPDLPKDAYFFAGKQPIDNLVFIENIAYDPRPPSHWAARLGAFETRNAKALCADNYLAGLHGLNLALWSDLTATGNTVWGPLNVLSARPDRDAKGAVVGKWNVDRNTYIAPEDSKAFNYLTFADYRKATGLDANSTLIPKARPATNIAFVRPNRYEAGRAFVAVFNWEGKPEVAVDLSAVLKPGASYEIYNVQDLSGLALAHGVYNGRPLLFSALKSRIAPDFDTYLVKTVPAAPRAKAPTLAPTSTLPSAEPAAPSPAR